MRHSFACEQNTFKKSERVNINGKRLKCLDSYLYKWPV